MKDLNSVKRHLATLGQGRGSGDIPKALQAANALRRLGPTNRKVLAVLFELHTEIRDWARAIEECQRLAVLDPEIAINWLRITTTVSQSASRRDGFGYAKRAFLADPRAGEVQLVFAGMLLGQNISDQDKIDQIDRVLKTAKTNDPHATLIRAGARREAGRMREAARIIADFLNEGHEPNSKLLSDLAGYLASTGRLEEARRAFLLSAAYQCEDVSDLLGAGVRAAALAKRIPSPKGIEIPELEIHRGMVRADAICHLVIFVRHFIDLDHFTPVIAEWVGNVGFFASVVIADADLPESDFRLGFLRSCPRLRVFRLQDLAPTRETDMIFEDIAKRIIVDGCRTVVCADGSHEPVYRELAGAFEKFGVPFLGLPHGEGAVLNLLQRTDLLTFDDLEKRAVEPIYSGYLFSNRFALDQWLSISSVKDPRPTAVVGSARYSERWVRDLDDLPYPRPVVRSDNSLNVVLFLIDSIYNVWDAEMARTIDAILSIDGIRLILHDHPRRHLRSDDRRGFVMTAESLATNCRSPDSVTVIPGTIPGMGLVRTGDVFLSLGSSIVIEAIRLNRPALELSYLHANKTLVSQELPECDIRCRDDLLVALTNFVERKSRGLELNTFYDEAGRMRFLNDLLDAGHENPLGEQVGWISDRALIPRLNPEGLRQPPAASDVPGYEKLPGDCLGFLYRRFAIPLGDSWIGVPSTEENCSIVLLGGPNTLEALCDIARQIGQPDWTACPLEDVLDTMASRPEFESSNVEIWFSMADFPILREVADDDRFVQLLPRLRLVEFFIAAPPAVDKWIASLVAAYGKGIGSVEPNRLRGELNLLLQLVAGRVGVSTDDQSLEALRPLYGVLGDLAFTYLALGDLDRGWWLYEASKKRELREGRRPFPQPLWLGESLRDQTILLWRNRGPGDEILYANAFQDVIAAAGHVVIETDPRLKALFSRSFPDATVVSRSEWPHPPEITRSIDLQAPYGSACRYFRPTISRFPQHVGYLQADPDRSAHWKRRLARDFPGRPVVGISWRTGSYDAAGLYQTAIEEWTSILGREDAHFISLQYDCDNEEIDGINRSLGCSLHMIEGIDLFNALDDLAALISALDLVISIDNINANLAGALGVRTIQLTEPWGHSRLGQNYCPFYPSVKLVPLSSRDRVKAFEATSDFLTDTIRNA
jgi:hypothetical protein